VAVPVLLTEVEQAWFDEIYSKADFNHRSPHLTATVAKKVKVMYLHLPTVEDVNELYAYAENDPYWSKNAEEVSIHIMEKVLNKFLEKRKRAAAQAERTQKPVQNENELVWWTKCISGERTAHKGTPLDCWYLYEKMPLKEARELFYDSEFITTSARQRIDTQYRMCEIGVTKYLPPEASLYEQYITPTARKYYQASVAVGA
jgi:hypothetical protein